MPGAGLTRGVGVYLKVKTISGSAGMNQGDEGPLQGFIPLQKQLGKHWPSDPPSCSLSFTECEAKTSSLRASKTNIGHDDAFKDHMETLARSHSALDSSESLLTPAHIWVSVTLLGIEL